VREKHIKNQEARVMFHNIPNVDAFIDKRVAKYIGKAARSSDTSLPKKFLATWINEARKPGGPQLTCNNNFAKVIKNILPTECTLTNNNAPIKECPSPSMQRMSLPGYTIRKHILSPVEKWMKASRVA
jgi:hypothetical protein